MRSAWKHALILAAFLHGPLPAGGPLTAAQDGAPALLQHLRAGKLGAALAELEQGAPSLSGPETLEAAELFTALAEKPGTRPEAARAALEQALALLGASGGAEPAARREAALARAGLGLGALLAAGKPRPLGAEHRAAVEALERARAALLKAEPPEPAALKRANLLLLPLVRELKRTGQVLALCRETLALPLSPAEASLVGSMLGEELLGMGKVSEALPYLEGRLRENPADPELVGPIASALQRSAPDQALGLLLPVIQNRPRGAAAAWTACLEEFYRALAALPERDEPARSLLSANRIDLPLPQIWPGTSWRPGFRVWRPDDTNPGKTYSGRHSLKAMLPFSAGWRRLGQPPQELRRWNNAAFCLQREGDGPTLVAYWFAPDLAYWYGSTPAERGVTSKKVMGDSKGGVAAMVEDACYGKHALERGLRFAPAPALPFPLGAATGVTRKSWKWKSWVFHEAFFSIGQVTVEVLLQIRPSEIELLEPELRWLLRSVGP